MGDPLREALAKLLDALDDSYAGRSRETDLSPNIVAVLPVDEWEAIRAAEAEVREALSSQPVAPVDDHPEPITVYSCSCGWRGTNPPRYRPTFPNGPFKPAVLGKRYCPNAPLTLHREYRDAPLVAATYIRAGEWEEAG